MSSTIPIDPPKVAFKEWAVVCTAIASGRQSILLRKGGIHEGRSGFQAKVDAFWLFPTRFHQAVDDIIPAGRIYHAHALATQPTAGRHRLDTIFRVDKTIFVETFDQVSALSPWHIYQPHVLQERFDREPVGLTVMIGTAFQTDRPVEFDDAPQFGGCRSWLELPESLIDPTRNWNWIPAQNAEESRERNQGIIKACGQSIAE